MQERSARCLGPYIQTQSSDLRPQAYIQTQSSDLRPQRNKRQRRNAPSIPLYQFFHQLRKTLGNFVGRLEKDKFTARASNMKNDVEQAMASNMEDDESSAPNKGKFIDVGSDSDIDKDINNLSASNEGKDTASTSSISNPELKIEMTSKILAHLHNKMEGLTSQQDRADCCIYRVPKSLRGVNWKAYTPLLISIGPLHRETKRIEATQNHKWRCFKEFTEQDGMNEEKIRDLVISIQNKEKYIRICYSEKFNRISSCDFIEMILLDAVFIIKFLNEYQQPNHFEPRMMFDIREDLILLENQLPFSIIWDIYQEINRDLQDATWESFLDLVTYVFGKHTGDIATFHFEKHKFSQVAETRQIVKGSKHFTDLLRSFMLKGSIERTYSFNPIKLKYSAVMLRKAGVKFQVTQDKCLVNIKFEKGVLKIPRLEVDHSFERLVRNIMALEQCCYQREAYVCSYIKFMDHLIDSAEDVGLLVENGIILHWLGDDAAVSNVINNFCENIGNNYTCFGDISQEINSHYESRFNHTKATLKLIYFANIWRGTATVAAAILLILTFIQTISSVKSL